MPSLRERQKIARRETILAVAETLLRTKGYTKTSMEDVAHKANVGVATIYNYFGTKFDLVRAMLEPEVQRVKNETAELFLDLPDDPLEGIVALVKCYEIGTDWRYKKMLEPFAKDYFLLRKGKNNTFHDMSQMRVTHLNKLIKHYKKVGALKPDFNEDDAISIISGLFFLQLRDMMLTKSETPDQGIAKLERRVRAVCIGLLNGA